MRGFTVKRLAEVAIRCADVAVMRDFYRDIIGLEVMGDWPEAGICFLKIAEGYAGHTSVLALFARDAGRAGIHPHGAHPPVTGAGSSFHHFALNVDREEQDAVITWYAQNGQEHQIEEFAWIGWRGVFTKDPEGNTVELVAYDPNLAEQAGAR